MKTLIILLTLSSSIYAHGPQELVPVTLLRLAENLCDHDSMSVAPGEAQDWKSACVGYYIKCAHLNKTVQPISQEARFAQCVLDKPKASRTNAYKVYGK